MSNTDDCERLGRLVHTSTGVVLLPKPKRRKRVNKPKIRDTPMTKRPIEEQIYHRYKTSAERRGKLFELRFADFMRYWQKPCRYCKDPIETIGIDRLDNNLGYTVDNIDSCCTMCNLMKHKKSEEEFIRQCAKIAQNSSFII